ncbi:MAG: hypothetical protein J6E38_09380 [Clostridia bacterium]|nr:hypothetical protein [Clostridia bacterium]
MFDKSLYKAKRLFADEGFENGFRVRHVHPDSEGNFGYTNWSFPESKNEPSWTILPLYSEYCLIEENKDVSNPYVLTDKGDSKVVTYNPEEKSLSLKLDASKVYKGKTTVEKFWPHLLIEQKHICDYKNIPEGDEKTFYSASSDRIAVEFDIRLTEYIPTTVPADKNVCQFVGYVYLNLVDANHIYFGFNPFDNRGPQELFWHIEAGGSNHIYIMTTEQVFGNLENSFCPVPYDVKVSDEWKHIEVDLTPHIEKILQKANEDLIFGRPVTRDEFYFSGTNLGFETHGNISCTFEIKNYNLVSYIKK